MSKKIPDFLIIGTAKAGTTTLAKALEEHPEVYVTPTKETNFFALKERPLNFFRDSISKSYLADCIVDDSAYREQFYAITSEKVAGEASPSYLYFPEVPQHIKNYNSEAKLIAILRDPIDRAYSNFLHHIRDDLETVDDFCKALALEEERIRENWWWGFHYIQAGLYYSQIKRYLDLFPSDQIKIWLYEDLTRNQADLIRDLYHFLEVDANFIPDLSIQQNKTGVPKNKFLNRFVRDGNTLKTIAKPLIPKKLRKQMIYQVNRKNLSKPKLSSEMRQQILPFFKKDILKLQDLIGRDLSTWLQY